MTRDEFVGRVAADTEQTAQDALGWLISQGADNHTDVHLVLDVASALSQNRRLSKRTQAHRLELLLWSHPPPRDQESPIAQAARGFPPHLQMAVANAIPAGARLELYGSRRQSETRTAEDTGTTSAPVVETDHQASGSPDTEQATVSYSTVLLLAHPDRLAANRRQIENAGLDTIAVESPSEAKRVLADSAEICGCAIDQSALAVLDTKTQEALFKTLAEYSSFIAIRVHETDALRVSHNKVRQIIKTARQLSTLVPSDAISFRSDGTIQEAELSFYQHAAKLLESHRSTPIIFGDLNSAEAHLLVAATHARVRAERVDTELASGPLTVRFLTGGRSGAKLATVVCGDTPTFVAKITSKNSALEEMRRFKTLVQPWNDLPRLECHFHGEIAVVLSTLFRGDDDPSTPAESLQKRLRDVWNGQWFQDNTEEAKDAGKFLEKALPRVAQTLAELNRKKPPPSGNFQSCVNPPATHLDTLDHRGFVWGFNERAMRARRAASKRVRRMENSAIVHGDIHLRNILIRGESEVHVIDYAASASGHPAVDLVRFELALYLGPVRQFEDEASSVEFQRALSIDRAPLEVLRRSFQDFFQCHINSACAAGMTEARDAALEVVGSHGGNIRDYLAMKFLVAWQHLGFIGSQTGLARAVILATAEDIAAW